MYQDLYNYLYENTKNRYIIELLQYEINKRIYYFGNNFINPWEKSCLDKNKIKQFITSKYKTLRSKSLINNHNLVLSDAYFTVNDELKKNCRVVVPWWTFKRNGIYLKDTRFQKLFYEINQVINNARLDELISEGFIKKITLFINAGEQLIVSHDFKAGIFSNDLGFYERIFIDILKKLNIPTFIFLHGLPARYNNIDDNRADYLIVWGDKIKENYIKAGVDSNKIIVSGHPAYSKPLKKKLKNSLDEVLVISKAMNGAPSISNDIILSDRGNCLLYLKLIQEILKEFGVKKAKLRIHPSENPDWYKANIDTGFFTIDRDNLINTLKKSTLVIGPTSTVFLESIYWGVNYLVFEPSINDIDLMNYPLVSPFDGTDNGIPVAKNLEEFKNILINKKSVESEILKDYISPEFDLSEVFSKIKYGK